MELIRRIRDWVFTVPTLVAFGAVMVITDPILRLVRFFGDRPMSVVAQWAQATLLPVFKLSGAKVSSITASSSVASTPMESSMRPG